VRRLVVRRLEGGERAEPLDHLAERRDGHPLGLELLEHRIGDDDIAVAGEAGFPVLARRLRAADSIHHVTRDPNLVERLELTHPDQFWVADITDVSVHEAMVTNVHTTWGCEVTSRMRRSIRPTRAAPKQERVSAEPHLAVHAIPRPARERESSGTAKVMVNP
jgi:hypothetical protein